MTRINIRKFVCISVLVSLALLLCQANAQVGFPDLESFIIEFSPANPGPNTEITAKIISYSFDVDRSTISWQLNGKTIKQGKGEKIAKFTNGDTGSRLSLVVSVTTENGLYLRKTKTLDICDLDLLWETSTYTPLNYKGRAQPTSNSEIKITAIPHGMGTNFGNLIYEWKKNYKNLPDDSGIGRNSYSFVSSKTYIEDIISVTVSTLDKTKTMEKTITIRPDNPEIMFYEESPSEGPIYSRSLERNFSLTIPEISIRAEPYFFSKKDIENLSFEWQLNNKKITPFPKTNIVGLSLSPDTEGIASLILEILNSRNVLQAAKKSLQIQFNE